MSKRLERHHRARSAAKWTILTIVVANAALVACFQSNPCLHDMIFDRRFNFLRARLPLMSPNDPIVLMVGSSRTMNVFDASAIEATLAKTILADREDSQFFVHNLGVMGCGPAQQYVFTKRALDAGIRPTILLIEFSARFTNGKSEIPPEVPFCSGKFTWREERDLLSEGWPREKAEVWDHISLSWFDVREGLTRRIAKHWMPNDPRMIEISDAWGFHRLPRRELDEKRPPKGRRKEYFLKAHDGWTPEGAPVLMLHRLVELCRRERIMPILVVMPEGSELHGYYTAEAKASIRAFLARFGREQNLLIVDCWEWLEDEYFADEEHTNDEGAQIFSARLCRESLIPWFKGTEDDNGNPARGSFRTTSTSRSRMND
jgi:hypothetical protein